MFRARTPSEPFEVELRNESEMSANFKWEVPLKMEACGPQRIWAFGSRFAQRRHFSLYLLDFLNRKYMCIYISISRNKIEIMVYECRVPIF